jgi:glutathione S-transferase
VSDRPRLFGADYSVYVRIARLVLSEKGIDYDYVPVDIFDRDNFPDWYLERHPFKRIPAFQHGELRLFETSAITRYVDEAFDGPALQPVDAAARAAMNQTISLLDAYAYRAMVWGVFVERVEKTWRGEAADEATVASALEVSETCLASLAAALRAGDWLAGDQPTLADLHAAPMIGCFVQADEGRAMLDKHPRLTAWWSRMEARASFEETRPTSN